MHQILQQVNTVFLPIWRQHYVWGGVMTWGRTIGGLCWGRRTPKVGGVSSESHVFSANNSIITEGEKRSSRSVTTEGEKCSSRSVITEGEKCSSRSIITEGETCFSRSGITEGEKRYSRSVITEGEKSSSRSVSTAKTYLGQNICSHRSAITLNSSRIMCTRNFK